MKLTEEQQAHLKGLHRSMTLARARFNLAVAEYNLALSAVNAENDAPGNLAPDVLGDGEYKPCQTE